ncbi:hypothetical protein F4782DRAFT_529831 [Xylaria castorea]|nr:hypothetical protein F4782DRAFT_529831 [Xylaria castorea]
MASIQQPRAPIIHSWTVPAHYLQCSICREYRRLESRRQEILANNIGRMVAINVGQDHRHRILSISPRLHDPRLRRVAQQEGLYPVTPSRRVTIQVPSLGRPVRTNSSIGLPIKRSRSFNNNPDPAQYLVPEQLDPRSGVDIWAANSEAIRLGSPASTPAKPSPTFTVAGHFELSMPGTWPSWADEPNPVPPLVAPRPVIPRPVIPRPHIQRDNPADNPANPDTNGFFTFFGGFSAFVLGALRVVRWRVAEPVQPAPVAQPAQPAITATAPITAVTQTPQTTEYDGSRIIKRPRTDRGSSHQRRFSRCGPSYPSNGRSAFLEPLPSRRSTHLRRDGRTGSSSNRRRTSYESIAPSGSPKINETDPNFNHAGHFSLDAIETSDSEDEEYPGSPMDIDSPEPIVSQPMETILAFREPIPMDIDSPKPIVSLQTEAILARPIEPRHTQSEPKLDVHTPIALNKTEAISALQPIDPINPINDEPSPKLDSATAAARRAVKFFPKDSPSPKARVSPSAKRTVGGERRHKVTTASTFPETPSPDKTEKTRYDDILEFFPNDIVHSLPGLGDESLPADGHKVELLKRELMERLRREELESQNAALSHLGVRRAKATLITEPSSEWMNRALDAPKSGTFDPRAVHPDAVELKPRDFAKLVPPTAWLNDDCVHSTLCCLAAYINKKANVKPKVGPPKCVAVSSLYWKAFCGDHKKLYPRPFSRKWNMTPDNFLKVDTILIPVNSNSHWTLIAIRPSRRTVSYLDSFHHRNDAQLRHAYQWLQLFLGDKFVPEDWETKEFSSPQQTNAWDCGMFVITNAMCLALGISPMCYDEEKMPMQRQRIAAMLLNGGFQGEFDLSHL